MTTLALFRPPGCAAGRRLILIERNALLCRSFERFFRLYFDEVQIASDPAAATLTLQSCCVPTDLICGMQDESEAQLAEWVERWRNALPLLGRVLVVTGCNQAPTHIVGVDTIIEKPIAPEVLLQFFAFRP